MSFAFARKQCLSCGKMIFPVFWFRRLATASQEEKVFDLGMEQFVRSQWDESVNAENPVVQRLKQGILAGSRSALAESITLVESRNPTKKAQGEYLLAELLHESQQNPKKMIFRVGISGSPGVGKSSLIETLGKFLTTEMRKKVAVLTIDPSSVQTGGSLLGDMSRMPELSKDPNAYIRSSPSRGTLGGVTHGTREAIYLCEGAGYDVVLIETVGVGQSEIAVGDIVDMFVLLLAPAQGDELQGLKRGIIEISDLVLVTKADGTLLPQARNTQAEYISALKYIRPRLKIWRPQVLRCSAHTGEGVPEVWETMLQFWHIMQRTGQLKLQRDAQLMKWMWQHVENQLVPLFKLHPAVLSLADRLKMEIIAGTTTPGLAAEKLLRTFLKV